VPSPGFARSGLLLAAALTIVAMGAPRCGSPNATAAAPTSSPAAPRQVAAAGAEHFASPQGTPQGDGSKDHPWDLASALTTDAVFPGDTIWLRGGTYRGTFHSYLTGTPQRRILVRQYPGERAIIDGGDSGGQGILTIGGGHTTYWGFEITSSDPDRVSSTAEDFPSDLGRGEGVVSDTAVGIQLVNLVIHDTRQGVGAFRAWRDAEIRGCILYYNGWQSSAGGYGHGIYAQNEEGIRRIADNILFHQFSHGIHAYSESGPLDNIVLEGNVLFENGLLATLGTGRNLLLGGLQVARNPAVRDNMLYFPPGGPVSSFDLGYSAGCENPTITGNYVADNTYLIQCANGAFSSNTFYGRLFGFSPSSHPGNLYLSERPTQNRVFVRRNADEPGRGTVVVYNWEGAASVAVDLRSVLSPGDGFLVRNVQDYFGAPVLQGRYEGAPVSLPLTNLAVAPPVGWPPPPSTGPGFAVFVVETTSVARPAPAVAPASPRAVGPKTPRAGP
jgi:hypothetical protein